MIVRKLTVERRTPTAALRNAASVAAIATALVATPAFGQDQQPGGSAAPAAAAATAVATSAAADAAQPAPNAAPGGQPDTANQAAQQQAAQTQGQSIVITGFRRSLQAAINIKRESVGEVDAIVAEDIAKFPDQNLAEALERIPGISITRSGGEGNQVTVRGLGPEFTQVRLNGLETIATSAEDASSNRDRAFDFNVFAAELFRSVVVHKTAEAALDEGSMGGVIDLNTGNALANHTGLTLVANAQASYNDLSKNWGPRLSGLVGWKNDAGTLAIQASAAYQQSNNFELGNNTTRWDQAMFRSVNGTQCFKSGNYVPSSSCDAVALAFHPRIPRYGFVRHDLKRLGLTGNIDWKPSEWTHVSVDGLYSHYSEDREEKWGEVLFRSNEKNIDITNYTIDQNNNLVSGTFNNAYVRTEHYLRKQRTKFYQFDANWDQNFGDRLKFTLLGGFSKSDANIPVETTMLFDNRTANGYHYDYTNMQNPVLSFGNDMTNPANFQLAEIRDRPSNVTNTFRTAQLRSEWDATDNVKLQAGFVYRRYKFDDHAYQRDTTVCPANGKPDVVLGTISCSSTVYGFPVTSSLADLFTLTGVNPPSGTTTQWLIADLPATTAYTGLYNRTAVPDQGNIRNVIEVDTGGYLQADAKGHVFGLRYAANAGVRYMRTDQTSTGLLSGVAVTKNRVYEDWLPAANLALYPTEKLIIRAAVAKVMTRPSLGNLTPGGSADGFNFRVTFGNPDLKPFLAWNYDAGLEWYFAPESIASVAVFRKDVSNFPLAQTISGQTFDSTGLPASVLLASSPAFLNPALRSSPIWDINTQVNAQNAKFEGVELGVQGPFRFLPGFLRNFGGIANATFIKSHANYTVPLPFSQISLVNGKYVLVASPSSAVFSQTFLGLSKRAYSGTLFYDDGRFSARVSMTYRSPYITSTSGNHQIFEGFKAYREVDASIRYNLNDHIQLSADGINLTDEYRDRWVDIDAQRNYEHNHFGRTYIVGVRYKY
jgi:TonB-dependent receptor